MRTSTKAIIFDLDGTLVDSAGPIATALNRMRARKGLPGQVSRKEVKQWVSLGAEALVRHALAGAYRDGDLAEFRAEYAAVTTPPACVYEGVPEMLDMLTVNGVLLAVCSNKPQQLCVKVLRETRILRYFRAIVGGDAVARPKPHPEHLTAAIAALGASCADSLYIGDSSVDFLASRAAGVPFLLAAYGYADPLLLQMDRKNIKSIDSPRALAALQAGVRA